MDFVEVFNSLCAVSSLNIATASMNCFSMQRVFFIYILKSLQTINLQVQWNSIAVCCRCLHCFPLVKNVSKGFGIENVAASFTRVFLPFLTRFAEAEV